MPKKKKIEEEEEEEEGEEVYHVEVITKARVSEEGEWEYLVKWAGYESDADSWEPTENVKQCDRLLTSFWKHVGMDNNDYPIGYEVAATEEWIAIEKRYFEQTFTKPSKQKVDKPAAKEKQEKRKSKSNSSYISDGDDTDDADDADYQSSDEGPSVKKLATKAINRMAFLVDSESEPEPEGSSRQMKAGPHMKATTPPSKSKIPTQVKRPLATGGSLSIAAPKITAVRTHQEQRTNPLVKTIKLAPKSVEAGSSLSTKQRIAAGIPPPPTGPKLLPRPPRKSFSSLSFKKNKPPAVLTDQAKDTASTSTAVPTSPIVESKEVADDADVVASPQPMDVDEPVDIFDFTVHNVEPPSGSFDIHAVPIPPKSREEVDVDNFLQTIDTSMPSGPLDVTMTPDQPDQSITDLGKTLVIPKIPKKWKWSGDLFVSISDDKTELLCGVTISDPSGISNSSHINLLLSSLDSLHISRLYPVVDLSFLLRACGKSQYSGRLESSDSNEDVIHGLEHYMTTEGLAGAIPLLLDGYEAAVLLVFSEAHQSLTKRLEVPGQLLSGISLLVVLLPFLVPAMALTRIAGQVSVEVAMQTSFTSQGKSEMPSDLSQEVMLHQARFLLGFPKGLVGFLNNPSSRTYCIWPLPDPSSPGFETAMLQYVLRSCKAVLAKPEEDVRVIFISNEHLEALHTMPSLATKKANSPGVQFWTYGCSAGKVQEIYPLGGIVTFTCSALAEDLIGCYQVISQIIEHPLWDCYLIPEVLAASHLLSSGNMGSSESLLESILDQVTQGVVSLTKMPEKGNEAAWLSQLFSYSDDSGHELLKRVLESYPILFGMTPEQLISFTTNEVTKDLSRAQIQPALMENHRRFVVIRADSEDAIPVDKDGLEWSSLSSFSFKDDYFQS